MKLVFATHNQNKLQEVSSLLPETITLLSLNDIGCTQDIPETGTTLAENARIKSNFVVQNYGYDCFADDTGLQVNALGGAPGVYSARYAGAHSNSDTNMTKLLAALASKKDRSAQFKTVISLNIEGKNTLFEGMVEGIIIQEKRGSKGFGYDPIFQPKGFDQTFAELRLTAKNKIGHRGKAIKQLIQYLKFIAS